jgi:hypothetical protein
VTAPGRIAALISEAEELKHELKAARDEVVRLETDPFTTPAALQRASERLAWLNGVADGWVAAGWAEFPTLRRGD